MTRRILVVDDGRESVQKVRTYLERNNYEVLDASDCDTALRILRRERPDLMLLDLTLPERGGWDMTQVMQAALRYGHDKSNPSRVLQVGGVTVDLDAHRAEVDGQPLHLTPTEFVILRALAENPDRALTRQELIEKGLGRSYGGLERTVDSHIKNLRQKLGEAGETAHLVETVFGVGYRLASK
jgi:two-component system alkaline phosphatase synthesis response regulator PhoP